MTKPTLSFIQKVHKKEKRPDRKTFLSRTNRFSIRGATLFHGYTCSLFSQKALTIDGCLPVTAYSEGFPLTVPSAAHGTIGVLLGSQPSELSV